MRFNEGAADSRLTVDWTEDFKTAAPITTHLNVKGTLTEAQAEQLIRRIQPVPQSA